MANFTATYQQLLSPASAVTPVATALGTLARHPAVVSCSDRYALGTSLTLALWQAYFASEEALGGRGPPRSAAMLRAAVGTFAAAARDWAVRWFRLSVVLAAVAVLLPGVVAWAPFAVGFVVCHEAVGMLWHSYNGCRGIRKHLARDAPDDEKKMD